MHCSEFHQLLINCFFTTAPTVLYGALKTIRLVRDALHFWTLSPSPTSPLSTASPPSLSTFRTIHRYPLSTHTLLSPRSPLSRQTAAPRSLLERAGSGRLRGAADERGKNEHDVLDLEALGEYKCDSGMSVENVHVEGTIYCSQVLYGVAHGGGEECGKEEEYCRPVRNVLLDSKTKQGRSHG